MSAVKAPKSRSWVRGHFCAAHKDAAGRIHGHTWRVRAEWASNGKCAEALKRDLCFALSELDHSVLPDRLSTAEAISKHLGTALEAVLVEVWREDEGMGAVWER
jgi:6-pyruvoyl-tetrahydropterin synthase